METFKKSFSNVNTPRFQKILITGAAGFAGRHLIRELQAHGHDVFTTDALPAADIPAYRQTELRDRAALKTLVREAKPDACIHLGAISFVPDGDSNPEMLLTVNIAGTVNVAEAIRSEAPACRMLFVSTAQVYGPVTSIRAANVPIRENAPLLPLSMYAISKAAAEQAVLAFGSAYGIETLIARPANHTGPGQSPKFVAVSFARQMVAVKRGECSEVRVGNLDSVRDFTDVRDVVKAYRLIVERGQSGLAYNITTNARVRIGELLDRLQGIVGVKPEIVVDPALHRPGDASLKLDVSRLRDHTSWIPEYELDQTLADIVESIE